MIAAAGTRHTMAGSTSAVEQLFGFIDGEYRAEVEEYAMAFARIDRHSPDALRAWLQAHPYLTTNDLCRIARVSHRTAGKWRRLAGVPSRPRTPPRRCRLPRPGPVAPPDWENGTWLQDQYPRYSVRQISRAVGRSYTWTRRLLLRRGVRLRSAVEAVRSRHPCCQQAWLSEHYIERGLSLTTCARLAGVSSATLTAWVLRFGFRVRTAAEQLMVHWHSAARRAHARARARQALTPQVRNLR